MDGTVLIFAGAEKGLAGQFRSVRIEGGLICLTLPTEAGRVSANLLEDTRSSVSTRLTLEWDADFGTDAVKSVVRMEGALNQFRLTDAAGKHAIICSPDKAEPTVEAEKLVIRVSLQQPSSKNGELTGQILDEKGKPLEKACVSLIYVTGQSSGMSGDKNHQVRTDAQGRYRLTSIVPQFFAEEPWSLQLAVTCDGFAGVDTKTFQFKPPVDGPQTVDPVHLSPGMSVKGVVHDLDGKPAAGVWVRPGGSYASRAQFTKTDAEGQFVVRDLPAEMVSLSFNLGDRFAGNKFWAERDPKPVEVHLKPLPAPAKTVSSEDAAKAAAEARKAVEARLASPPKPPAGAAAPEWDTDPWSDGKVRKLQDYRGKVVFLDFWGIWCGPCLHALPTLEKLRTKYEKQGVVFLSIHTPGDDEKTIRKVLESKKVSLAFALDRTLPRADNDKTGVSSERFGINGYPTFFLIDRAGKIAFRNDDPALNDDFFGIVKELGFDEKTVTEEQGSQVLERFLEKMIEKVVGSKAGQ